jgi:ABC-type bacteriocin/lantibiotic exporter with double-glycine peptidase domain
MSLLTLIPILLIVIYVSIVVSILYLIYTWVNKFIELKQEQNNLLKEIIEKMDLK